mmetsp:Transcript_31486/g.76133  ORF Transcript_31486/g.76133 Transcript_31486/m.76133 type:complete len:243 (+) Transcript_31486:1071-1799(+)
MLLSSPQVWKLPSSSSPSPPPAVTSSLGAFPRNTTYSLSSTCVASRCPAPCSHPYPGVSHGLFLPLLDDSMPVPATCVERCPAKRERSGLWRPSAAMIRWYLGEEEGAPSSRTSPKEESFVAVDRSTRDPRSPSTSVMPSTLTPEWYLTVPDRCSILIALRRHDNKSFSLTNRSAGSSSSMLFDLSSSPLSMSLSLPLLNRSLTPKGDAFSSLLTSHPPSGVLYPTSRTYDPHASRSWSRVL